MAPTMTHVPLVHYRWQIGEKKSNFINQMLLILETAVRYILFSSVYSFLLKHVTDKEPETQRGSWSHLSNRAVIQILVCGLRP